MTNSIYTTIFYNQGKKNTEQRAVCVTPYFLQSDYIKYKNDKQKKIVFGE